MSFFQCDCVRMWYDHVKWCNRTVHDEHLDDCDHDGCDGTRNGEQVHCTDYSVDYGDVIKCTMCDKQWVHSEW